MFHKFFDFVGENDIKDSGKYTRVFRTMQWKKFSKWTLSYPLYC